MPEASEGLRLLLGGPLRDPWVCPYVESGGEPIKICRRLAGQPGNDPRRFSDCSIKCVCSIKNARPAPKFAVVAGGQKS